MNATLDNLRTRNRNGEEYAWDIGIDFGRPELRFSFTMRDLIHWTACRLDTGADGHIPNHRAASLLRGIAEEFYPYASDTADYLIEELQDAGCTDDFELEEYRPAAVDLRLLDLREGFICVKSTFEETLWSDQERNPTLVFNAGKTIDFPFPPAAVKYYGVAGLRICVLDLVQWFRSAAQLHVMSYNSEDSWLAELEAATCESRKMAESCFSDRMARYGDDWQELLSRPEEPSDHSEEPANEILRELEGLI